MTTAATKSYRKLKKISRECAVMESIHQLLSWDQETYMPAGASAFRAEQMQMLAGLGHKRRSSAAFRKALSELIDLDTGVILIEELTAPQKAALQQWRRDFIHDTALPNSFVKKMTKLVAEAREAWKRARKENNYSLFRPYLDKIVTMCRKKADLLGFNNHPYDALIDLHEPYMTTEQLRRLFKTLRDGLVPLIRAIGEAPVPTNPFEGKTFPLEQQMALNQRLLQIMNYPKNNGRLDLSVHPFCLGVHPTDTRVTTRLEENDLFSGMRSALHEGGHALYEMNLPQEEYGTPLCQGVSLGIHESQSRLWETRVGQSLPFITHLMPTLREFFPQQLEGVSAEQLYAYVNKVTPSLIRVEADEVTYPLHVVLRFDLECQLLEGTLSTKDLPDAWSAKMQEYLGITPPSDTLGCLQDIHWSLGAIGYFPTYALGSVYATQIFDAYCNEHAEWHKQLETGDLATLGHWLRHRIHEHGRHYSPQDLLKNATGTPPSTVPYLNYLISKYGKLYGLNTESLLNDRKELLKCGFATADN